MKKRKILLLVNLFILAVGVNPNLYAQKKGYEKSIEVGASIGIGDYSNNTFGVAMINGYRFSDYLFAGVGVGIGYSNFLNGIDIDKYDATAEYRTDAYLIPIFANIKANLTKGKCSPFFLLNLGYTFDANQYLKDAPGFMLEPAFGVDFNLSKKQTIYVLAGFNLQHSEYSYTRNMGTTSSDWDAEYKSEMLKSISLRLGFKF